MLVEENKKLVYYLAFDFTGNREDAEDVSQEVFIKAYRSLKSFRGDSKFSTWLYRITVNTCISLKRKKSYSALKPEESMDEVKEKKIEITESFAGDPEKSAESVIDQQNIEEALNTLSKREKTVFVLRNYNELPFEEIGKILSLKLGTMRSLNFRALKKLRKALHYYQNEYQMENTNG